MITSLINTVEKVMYHAISQKKVALTLNLAYGNNCRGVELALRKELDDLNLLDKVLTVTR